MRCVHCEGRAIKNGRNARGKQRFRCRVCNKVFITERIYRAYQPDIDKRLVALLKEGVGTRSIGRILGVSKNTVSRRILRIRSRIRKPYIPFGRQYELDELRTFVSIKTKLRWVAYAIDRRTGQVADFRVGTRSNKTLRPIVETLLLSKAAKIHTDGLLNYKLLIPKGIHKVKQYGTNRIERMNLTLRTHLKRLNRRTICFNRSILMLEACLAIYFWG